MTQEPPTPSARERLDLTWLDATREWGVRAESGKHGMTLDAIRVGSYGEIPEADEHGTELPRGAYAKEGALPSLATLVHKRDVWSDLAPALYEEGVQRRWRPATDIPWASAKPLGTYTELAMRQLCTGLSELALVSSDALGGWQREISYAYYEVKMMLAGQQFDCMRHFDGFRKRAELHVEGLGYESPGNLITLMLGAATYQELVLYVCVMEAGTTLDLCRLGAARAQNEAEQALFAYAIQDVARRLTYGLDYARAWLEEKPQDRGLATAYLTRAEAALGADWLGDQPQAEALALLLGGETPTGYEQGQAALQAFRRQTVQHYLQRLSAFGMESERRERLSPVLRAALGDSGAPGMMFI